MERSVSGKSCNVGEPMRRYDGGGHQAAGTCQVDSERAETVLRELLGHIAAAAAEPSHA
jgi:nanoRNase/pAp phosphatase (c-di-AMP/oligoRNAs hydrolase)